MKKTVQVILSLLIAASMMLSGCGNAAQAPVASAPAPAVSTAPAPAASTAPAPAASVAPAAKKDTIVAVIQNEPTSLTTQAHNATHSSYINDMTHNGLFRTDVNGIPQMELLESYEAVSDTEFMMKLKPGIKFHDGTGLTSEDVKATLAWTATFAECKQYTSSVKDVEVIDDLTFKLITHAPSARLLLDLAHHANFIVPKALIDSGNEFNTNPIGTGPYVFKDWVFGDKLHLEAFDDYYDQANKASIPKLEWRVIPEGSSRTIALETGEADIIMDVSSNDIPRLRSADGIDVIVNPSTGYFFLMLNNEVPPYDNELVRRGINAGISKDDVVAVALNGLGLPGKTQLPELFTGVSSENVDGYDMELAKSYFQQAGVDPSTLMLDIIVSSDTARQACEVIQSNLGELGITVTINSMDNATALQTQFSGEYTGAIGGFTTSSSLTFLSGVFHSKMIGGSNRTRLNNPEIDAFIDKGDITIDADERDAIYYECTAMLNQIMTQVPLYQETVKVAYTSDLGGVQVNPSNAVWMNKMYWK